MPHSCMMAIIISVKLLLDLAFPALLPMFIESLSQMTKIFLVTPFKKLRYRLYMHRATYFDTSSLM